jgi:hypothetical protein
VAAACVTVVPDLPVLPDLRPTILHQAVDPPEGLLLEWPTSFSVPIQIATPAEGFVWSAFLDSELVAGSVMPVTAPDGGTIVTFPVDVPSTNVCPHDLHFVVAHAFIDIARRTPDETGGDFVDWQYYNEGPGGPQGCPPLDAGTGAVPDAAVDAEGGT